ncbi:helix-turn-helix domain-containing protein [Streptomyces sp. MAR4 CNX-425]|uniref:helix-turn-helix domain-containing protein n=1 Tax=Streptomyces sp. MAR4 CNX-425 TaxID=3406343 RepID=UPI003B50543E
MRRTSTDRPATLSATATGNGEVRVDGDGTPMERLRALDHLSPRAAAKAWGVPAKDVSRVATQITYVREGMWGGLARDRPRCPAPVTSFYGFPCKLPVEEGGEVCALHRKATGHPGPELADEALAVVQTHPGWKELRERLWKIDKRALQRERLRLSRELEAGASLTEEDFRLAALLLPSADPATQGRRALGLPGPNDGMGDAARLRGLGVLLAAVDAAVLGLPVAGPRQAAGERAPAKAVPKSRKPGPLLYSIAEAAERLGVKASWLRTESAAGRVPYRQIGGHRMFSEEDLEQIVKDAYRPSSGRTRYGRR